VLIRPCAKRPLTGRTRRPAAAGEQGPLSDEEAAKLQATASASHTALSNLMASLAGQLTGRTGSQLMALTGQGQLGPSGDGAATLPREAPAAGEQASAAGLEAAEAAAAAAAAEVAAVVAAAASAAAPAEAAPQVAAGRSMSRDPSLLRDLESGAGEAGALVAALQLPEAAPTAYENPMFGASEDGGAGAAAAAAAGQALEGVPAALRLNSGGGSPSTASKSASGLLAMVLAEPGSPRAEPASPPAGLRASGSGYALADLVGQGSRPDSLALPSPPAELQSRRGTVEVVPDSARLASSSRIR